MSGPFHIESKVGQRPPHMDELDELRAENARLSKLLDEAQSMMVLRERIDRAVAQLEENTEQAWKLGERLDALLKKAAG